MALPARNHRITLQDAAALARRHREAHAAGKFAGGAFHAMQVLELLQQADCVALRVYLGLENDGMTLILVGVDDTEQDMTQGLILEEPFKCPPICSTASPLNS
jgi:hypothetical protein